MATSTNLTGKHTCFVCEKNFIRFRDYLNHCQEHPIFNPYQCKNCIKTFNLYEALLNHNCKFDHSKEVEETENMKPTSVEKIFNKETSSKKNFKCSYCSKKFTRKNTLNRHLMIHSKEKPFKCKHCYRTFNRKFSLDNHVEKIHISPKNKEE